MGSTNLRLRLLPEAASCLVEQAVLALGDGASTLSPEKLAFAVNVIALVPFDSVAFQSEV